MEFKINYVLRFYSREELQVLLDRFPGSSIWRLPHPQQIGERGYATELNYNGDLRRSPIDPELGSFPGTLHRNSQGNSVKELQEALRCLGTYFAAIDGDFGPKTEAAVKAFQESEGLPKTGEVDLEIWKKLGGTGEIPGNNAQRIIDAIDRVNPVQAYYQPYGGWTYCNWFVGDVLHVLGIQLPRYDSSASGYPKPHPVYGHNCNPPWKTRSAEHLYNNYFRQGGDGKWQELTGWSTIASNARSGKVVVVVKVVPSSQIGHIAMVRPNSTANDIHIAQAGRVCSKDISVTEVLTSRSSWKYFVYTQPF